MQASNLAAMTVLKATKKGAPDSLGKAKPKQKTGTPQVTKSLMMELNNRMEILENLLQDQALKNQEFQHAILGALMVRDDANR